MPAIDLSNFKGRKKAINAKKSNAGLLALLNRDLSFGKRELNDKKKEAIYLELSSLLVAGVNLKEGLELIASDQSNLKDRQLFNMIQSSVVNGDTFANALEQTARFSSYEIFSVQIGEETGKLIEILN